MERVVLGLPQGWCDRDQAVEVDGWTWTTMVPSATYLFSASNADGNSAVTISIPSDPTVSYLRLDVSNNAVQGAPQIPPPSRRGDGAAGHSPRSAACECG